MLAFEKIISDKKHPFFIDYVVSNFFLNRISTWWFAASSYTVVAGKLSID
jgi:hypothetical protein